MRKLMVVFVVLASLFFAGCSTEVGQKFNQAQMDAFMPGKTTYDEVVKVLGEPLSNSMTGGKRQCVWAHVGAGLGVSSKATPQTAIYYFDARGIMLADAGNDNELTRAAKKAR